MHNNRWNDAYSAYLDECDLSRQNNTERKKRP